MSQYLAMHHWMIKMGLLILGALIIGSVEWIIYRRLAPRFGRKHHVWAQSFFTTFHLPFQWLLWSILVTYLFTIAFQLFDFKETFLGLLDKARFVIIVGTVFWFAMRFIHRLEQNIIKRAAQGRGKINDQTSINAIAQFARVILIMVILLVALQSVGIKISALLAFGGVGALVIGLAAKDNLANFIGGMMIYWDRPFSVGDWIRSPDREIEGTVENIGWRLTRIRTFDKRPLYLPNGILSNVAVENPSRMQNRRIKVTVGVRYDDADKIAGITHDIDSMLRHHPEIDTTQTLFVSLSELGPSSLNILVYTFTKTTQWVKFQEVQQDVLLKIMDIIAQHGAECAFPTRTLRVSPTSEGVNVNGVIREREGTDEPYLTRR